MRRAAELLANPWSPRREHFAAWREAVGRHNGTEVKTTGDGLMLCFSSAAPTADDEVDRFVAAGIPMSRLAIGIQFDGFVWAGGFGTDTGGVTRPRQEWGRSASKPERTDIGAPDVTVERYADIVDSFGAAEEFTRVFDEVARVPYLSRDSAADGDDRFISFDDEQAISEKAQFAKGKGLGGVFIFELTGDYFGDRPATERHPLLSAAKTAIKDGLVNVP